MYHLRIIIRILLHIISIIYILYVFIYNSIESVNDFYSTDYNNIYLCNNINHCARYVDYKIIIVIKYIVHGMYR